MGVARHQHKHNKADQVRRAGFVMRGTSFPSSRLLVRIAGGNRGRGNERKREETRRDETRGEPRPEETRREEPRQAAGSGTKITKWSNGTC